MSSRFRRSSKIRCKYLSWSNPKTGKTHRLPMLHVRLANNGISFRTTALIDSGATTTFIPTEMAQALELNLNQDPDDAIGAGGTFKNIIADIQKISLVKGRDSIFDEFTDVKVFVPVKTDAIPYMVLGRDLLFKRYDIMFEELNLKVTLKRRNG